MEWKMADPPVVPFCENFHSLPLVFMWLFFWDNGRCQHFPWGVRQEGFNKKLKGIFVLPFLPLHKYYWIGSTIS